MKLTRLRSVSPAVLATNLVGLVTTTAMGAMINLRYHNAVMTGAVIVTAVMGGILPTLDPAARRWQRALAFAAWGAVGVAVGCFAHLVIHGITSHPG